MIRVVIDTSVLVSAVISPIGPNAQVFDKIIADELRPYITEAVLAEYHAVFDHEHLQKYDRRRIARLRGLLERVGIEVKSRGRLKLSDHESDNRIYECALAAKARYIITENTRHFKKTHAYTRITTARQLLERMEAGQV